MAWRVGWAFSMWDMAARMGVVWTGRRVVCGGEGGRGKRESTDPALVRTTFEVRLCQPCARAYPAAPDGRLSAYGVARPADWSRLGKGAIKCGGVKCCRAPSSITLADVPRAKRARAGSATVRPRAPMSLGAPLTQLRRSGSVQPCKQRSGLLVWAESDDKACAR